MTYEDLYNQAMNGSTDAIKELNGYAGAGDAEAQYVLSCVYDNEESPFKDEGLGMYWLQKSAGYIYEPAIKRLKELSNEAKKKYGIETNSETSKGDSDADSTDIQPGGIWSFVGRIDRATYFVYLIVYAFIFGIIIFLINQIPLEKITESYGYYSYETWQQTSFAVWAGLLARMFALYLIVALGVKRLHDCGHSGWWVIFVLITAPIGPLYLLFKKGEEKTNEYGAAIE